MQGIDREIATNDWVTLSFLLCLVLLFFIKLINRSKLQEYSLAFFSRGFISSLTDKKEGFPFVSSILLMVFVIINFSLIILLLKVNFNPKGEALTFLKIIFYVFLYYSLKIVIDFVIIKTLQIKKIIRTFIYSKYIYLSGVAIWLFPCLLIDNYYFKSPNLLYFFIVFLFLLRFFLVLFNNKKLILNKLFYFILYLCTLEIAPLFIILKMNN